MKNTELKWKQVPHQEKNKDYSWCDNGFLNDRVVFQLYYDIPKKDIILYDMISKQSYHIKGGKADGYTIAFKLFKKYMDTDKL